MGWQLARGKGQRSHRLPGLLQEGVGASSVQKRQPRILGLTGAQSTGEHGREGFWGVRPGGAMRPDSTDSLRAPCTPHFPSISTKPGAGNTRPLTGSTPAKRDPVRRERASASLLELRNAKCHGQDGRINRNLFPHSSGGWTCQIKIPKSQFLIDKGPRGEVS